MSLANGRPYLAIPGPSVIPDRVLRAMHQGSPNIYEGPLIEMVASLWPDLRAVAGTTGHVAMYIGNGHAGWEAANANLFSRGDKALVLAVGQFGLSWANSARAMGIEVEVLDFGKSSPADMGQVEAALRADAGHRIKAVLTTHVDTASSIKTDIPALRAAMDAAGHPALLAVDCIASLGCDEFRMDEWGVDVMVAACQKGLMTPPGMAFVWFSEAARLRCGKSDLATPYWAWGPRAEPEEFWQIWDGTAPTSHLFGLREALNMLHEEGMPQVWQRHRTLAGAVWAAFDAWGAGNPAIGMNVANPADRGWSVTAARLGAPHATALRTWCETKAGVTLGIGLGMAPSTDPAYHGFLRVAHMGHVNAHMTLGALAVMEAGMVALGDPAWRWRVAVRRARGGSRGVSGWFRTRELEPGVHVTLEPAVASMFQAAMVTVLARDRDLQFDFGCGVMALRPSLPLTSKPLIAVASHAHVDHIGGFHEFADRRGHASEAKGFAGLPGVETFAAEFRDWPDVVAPPPPGWTIADWHLRPAPLTATLDEGDRIDLGDRSFTVLHLPGHSPGGIGLLDEVDGLFLSGDAIYDDDILDDLPGASIPDYIATMERLRHLDCRLAIGGHGPEMTRARMVDVAEAYLRRRA